VGSSNAPKRIENTEQLNPHFGCGQRLRCGIESLDESKANREHEIASFVADFIAIRLQKQLVCAKMPI